MVSLHCPRSEDHSVESVLQVGALPQNQAGTFIPRPVVARAAEEGDEVKLG